MKRTSLRAGVVAGLLILPACTDTAPSTPDDVSPGGAALQQGGGTARAEVWLVDQSNSPGVGYGGFIHIFAATDLTGERASDAAPLQVIDLAGATAAMCMNTTGVNPVRPHMLFFNATHSHAVLAFVASGHVVVYDAASRVPVACLRTAPGAGGARQAHAAIPSPDDSYILVANQNGKLLERIDANYAANSFVLNPAATLDLASCTTPSGQPCEAPALRPDNAPICPVVGRDPRTAWVTLRGGGLLVVDPTANPMRIIGEYDAGNIHPNGCGGVEAGGRMYIDSGGGTGANLHEFDLYSFPLTGYGTSNPANVPARTLVYSDDVEPRDAHGVTLVKGDVWVFDRGANVAEVFDAASGAHRGTVDLAGAESADPTPDLADVAPGGNRIFVTLRGMNPLSGDPHVSTGSTPGLGVVQVESNGGRGFLKAVVPISNRDADGVERADPHGIRVRRR